MLGDLSTEIVLVLQVGFLVEAVVSMNILTLGLSCLAIASEIMTVICDYETIGGQGESQFYSVQY
jgi:hypothetical protein